MTTATDYARELKVIRELLELTQAEFGLLLGIEGNSVMRYERSIRKVPEPTMRLARQLVHMRDAYRKEGRQHPALKGGACSWLTRPRG